MNCNTCRYWKRDKYPSWKGTPDEVYFGTCYYLQDQQDSQKYVAIYASRDGENIDANVETCAKFGCICYEKNPVYL